jgi:hypothetical protein
VVIGRDAKTAAAEAFTDSLKHGGRDIQVDLNVSPAGRCSVAVEVNSRTAHPSSTPCESGRSSVCGRVGHDFAAHSLISAVCRTYCRAAQAGC